MAPQYTDVKNSFVDLEGGTSNPRKEQIPAVNVQQLNISVPGLTYHFDDDKIRGTEGAFVYGSIPNHVGVSSERGKSIAKNNLENTPAEKEKKSTKKPHRPPRPPRSPSLDAADEKIMKEISELSALRRARIERVKALKKTKSGKSSCSSIVASVFTLVFFLAIIFHGVKKGRLSSVFYFSGSPVDNSSYGFPRWIDNNSWVRLT